MKKMTQSIKLSSNLIISSLSSTRRSRSNPIHSFNRSTSSFIPGRRSIEDHPTTNHIIIPKPTSPNWYTTHPALSDSLFKLDSIIKRSREELYRSNVLKRFSAPVTFEGTGIRLRWLKYRLQESLKHSNSIKSTTGSGVRSSEESESEAESDKIKLFNILWSSSSKWHDLEKMSELLQGNEGRSLRMIEYKITLKKLNEIKSLKRYLSFLNFSHLSSILQQDPHQKLQIERLNQEIDQILLKFLKPNLIQKSIQDKEFGRDRFGRFYGIGKKKESTARAWMIEVQVPESLPSSNRRSESDSSSDLVDHQISTIPSPSTIPEVQPIQNLQHVPLGQIFCNGRSITEYFHTPRQRATALRALEITDSLGHYNIHILTHGGGKMGQAAAISHALANALMNALQDSAKTDSSAQERYAKKVLSKSQLTLRDPRVVERKKTGKPGAKSSYRWVKR